MSFTVKFTRFAEQDFDEIIHHIAKDNPYQALKFVDELEKRTIQTLSVFSSKRLSLQRLPLFAT